MVACSSWANKYNSGCLWVRAARGLDAEIYIYISCNPQTDTHKRARAPPRSRVDENGMRTHTSVREDKQNNVTPSGHIAAPHPPLLVGHLACVCATVYVLMPNCLAIYLCTLRNFGDGGGRGHPTPKHTEIYIYSANRLRHKPK